MSSVEMKSLPKGWEWKKLGEVCKTGAGGTPLKSRKDFYENGDIPWLLSGEVAQGEIFEPKNFITKLGLEKSSAKLFPINTVLVAMYGATAGQVGLLKIVASTNQAVCGIYPNDKFLPKFVYYFFLMKKEDLIAQAAGNAQPNISQTKIKRTLIPIPPLAEQQKIVTLLDQAFADIQQAQANIEQNIVNAKELFQSKLNAIFSQRGEGWEERTLGEVAKYDKTKYKKNGNLPYVGLENIESSTGKFIGDLDPKEMKSTTFQFDNQHILYGRLRPYLNKVLTPDFKGHCSTEIFPILPKSNLILRKYLFYWLMCPNTVSKIDATWTGARMPRANMKEVINFSLPVPTMEKQRIIIENLDRLKTDTLLIESHYQQKLHNLEELKKSLLEKAFSGELTTAITV